MSLNEEQIPDPAPPDHAVTAVQLQSGMPVLPLDRLRIMDSDTWEDFTLELVFYWKTQYSKVVGCGGGGDMGRDVIAYRDNEWINFQCKHYGKKLSVADAVLEIGKIIYYSFIGEYSFPKKYYFVSPLGSSTNLLKVLNSENGTKIKEQLLARWDKTCKGKITSIKDIELDDALSAYIDSVDFSIFDDIPPMQLINLHSNTPFHAIRFGSYNRVRPISKKAPLEIDSSESCYTQALLDAFSEHKATIVSIDNLGVDMALENEFASARNNYYSADSLEKFSRDWLPADSFSELKNECYESVSPTVSMDHKNGYQRYLKVSEQASISSYDAHPLHHVINTKDKKGLCHHLVNDGMIEWVEKA